jgi:putative Ca2+/H+ antiporter (TMEM165/GDT1 family)
MGAFFIVDGLSAILGGGLLSLLPKNIIGIASGITFMMLGLISLTYGGKSKNQRRINGASLLKIFLLISLMELGDKTQVFSILLTAQFRNPLVVLTGIMSAFTIITAIGIFLGQKMLGLLPEKYLRKGTALVFTIFGLIQIVKVLLNINILF